MGINSISFNKLSLSLLNDTTNYANTQKNGEAKNIGELDLKKIIQVDFPENQYYKEQTTKNQIVLHHTVSGQGVEGDIAWWRSTAARIATALIVDWKGNKYQCFSSKYWAHHLGITVDFLRQKGFKDAGTRNLFLNKQSIGIEIDSWGGLVRYNRNWYPAKWDGSKNVANISVRPITNVQVYSEPYRGFYGFEKYTNEQIQAVRKLLVYWGNLYDIPLKYNADMWDVSMKALSGESGVWSHTSYRSDKSDIHPQPELIEMLKSL